MTLIEVEYRIRNNELHTVYQESSSIHKMNGMDFSVIDLRALAGRIVSKSGLIKDAICI